MEQAKGESRGLNILCIDGGGMRGLSSLLLVSEIMRRLEKPEDSETPLKPIDYFDVIAGTGTGGISACMLGRLGLSTEQATTAYTKLAKKVFSTNGPNGTQLREALKSMVQDATGNKDELMKKEQSEKNRCKTMVVARLKHNMNAGIPIIFRSYKAGTNPEPDCTVWEALYATTAHPDFFQSIEISDGPVGLHFVGGELECSNPIAHVLTEVRRLYSDRRVSCVLSIGAGQPHTIQISDPTLSERLLRTRAARAMKDMATDSERVAEEMAARFQHTSGVYYRLNVDQGMQDIGTGWEELSKVAAHARGYMAKVDINQMMDHAAKAILNRRSAISVISIDGSIQLSSVEQAVGLKRCPAPTSVYTGRGDQIQQVGRCIVPTTEGRRVCVVHGLGGEGKTQLALKAIELNRDSWTHIIYIDASTKATIESTLQDFAKAKALGTTHSDTLSWLDTCREPWLMMFDNADHPSSDIYKYFPGGNLGNILVTTRLPELAGHARGPDSVCHLSGMSQEDAQALLLKVAQIQEQNIIEEEAKSARALLKDFGYLALAVVHAGAYIAHSPHISFSKYRELFQAQRQRTLEQYSTLPVKLDEYGKSVYTTWRMCYDLLESNKDAQQMFWLMAYLHHDGISEEMFRQAATNILSYQPSLSETEVEKEARGYMHGFLGRFIDSNGCWDALRFSRAIGDLASHSLIEYDRVNQAYRIHVLVQDWVRTVILQTRNVALECTTIFLSQSINEGNGVGPYILRRKLGIHIDALRSERRAKIGANHARGFAMIYQGSGQWVQQETFEMHLREVRERELGGDHPDTLHSMHNLASTYRNQGQWTKAELLGVEVLDARKRVLGDEHPDTLTSMNNLALTYRIQGRWDKAKSLEAWVLDARKRVLSKEHPDTLCSMVSLACTYQNQGQWDKAEPLAVQAFDARKRVLGEEHPHTLSSMANLASTYREQGRWDEAESLEVQVLDARKRVLGEEHPDTLTSMGNLACTYWKQGRWSEAELLDVQVLDTYKRVLGEEHPDTLEIMGNLASTYLTQGRWDKAESLQVQVLDARKRLLGEEHPDTLSSMANLAVTYWNQGRWDEAELLQVQAFDVQKRLLGENHPDTLRSTRNIARAYQRQGRWDKAESLRVQVLDASKRVLGEEHPDTLTAATYLAETYEMQGRWREAESLLIQVVQVRCRALGDQHPRTHKSRRDLDRIRSKRASAEQQYTMLFFLLLLTSIAYMYIPL